MINQSRKPKQLLPFQTRGSPGRGSLTQTMPDHQCGCTPAQFNLSSNVSKKTLSYYECDEVEVETSSAVHSAMLVGFERAKMIGTSLNLENITISRPFLCHFYSIMATNWNKCQAHPVWHPWFEFTLKPLYYSLRHVFYDFLCEHSWNTSSADKDSWSEKRGFLNSQNRIYSLHFTFHNSTSPSSS